MPLLSIWGLLEPPGFSDFVKVRKTRFLFIRGYFSLGGLQTYTDDLEGPPAVRRVGWGKFFCRKLPWDWIAHGLDEHIDITNGRAVALSQSPANRKPVQSIWLPGICPPAHSRRISTTQIGNRPSASAGAGQQRDQWITNDEEADSHRPNV
jgi:hypothetical protein